MKKIPFKKQLHLVLILMLASATALAADLKLAADYWPPFTSERAGQRVAMDLVEQALTRSGNNAQSSIIPWQQVLEGIKASKFDGIVGAWKNAEREQYLSFSQPYLENRILLVSRTDNRFDFNDISQLENKKVGIVEDYAYGEAITKNEKIIKVKSASIEQNIKNLVRKECDFALIDSLVAQAMKQALPADIINQLVLYPTVVVTQGLHFAVRKNHPHAEELLKQFDATIEEMIIDGSYNRALGFGWLVVDTNADGIDEYVRGNQLDSITIDPALSNSGYPLYSNPVESQPRRPVRYRILNQEYDTWDEAQQAIKQAVDSGTLTREDTEDAISFSIGNF